MHRAPFRPNRGYKFAFYASSDHFSTHVSYAMVWTPTRDREGIFESIRRGRTYGATDNIVAEFRARAGDHEAFMGETLMTKQSPTFTATIGSAIRRSMAHRNADSVLPLPVGASSSVLWPAAMTGQPWR